MNVQYVRINLRLSDRVVAADTVATMHLDAHLTVLAMPSTEAAERLRELVAPLVESLVAAMQRDLRKGAE